MRLLVSVRDADEVMSALAGGADIVDAKEPGDGGLDPVGPAALQRIRVALPASVPFSVALGNVTQRDEARRAVEAVLGVEPGFVKLGFRSVAEVSRVATLISAAVEVAAWAAHRPAVVAVAYADWERCGSLAPDAFPDLAARCGAGGLLLDTLGKTGARLFSIWDPERVARWIARAHAAGLIVALGGGLQADDVALAAETGCDIIGVRGAACEGGRAGRVSTSQVRRLRATLMDVGSDYAPVRGGSVRLHAANPVGVTQVHSKPAGSALKK
jgi:uncharacterized protein (UPF0264 family)